MNSANAAATERPNLMKPLPGKKSPRGKPRLVRRRPLHGALRITPYAWAKLIFLRDAGPTEIGGFGISAAGEPLLVEDVRLVRQECDWASVAFDDAAVAEYFDEQVDLGRAPAEFARVWVHTHPGDSPSPSETDEETFARVFGGCDWAVMLILAAGGASYARLQFSAGPGGCVVLPVETAFEAPFAGSVHAAWQAEYDASVTPLVATPQLVDAPASMAAAADPYWDAPSAWWEGARSRDLLTREEYRDEPW